MKHVLFALSIIVIFANIVFAQTLVDPNRVDLTQPPPSYGYDNPLLNLYRTGKINTPPSFGGQIQTIIFCTNYGVRWTRVGPPRGGDYIWSPAQTRTYQYGPPSHSGQCLLGLYAPEYFCVVSQNPLVVFAGIVMTMIGSSR